MLPGNDISESTHPGNNVNFAIPPTNYAVDSPYYRTVAGEFELSDSPYGTFDQGGNVIEWNETVLFSSSRGLRSGTFFDYSSSLLASLRFSGDPTFEYYLIGFRVASIPEPGSVTLCVVGVIIMVPCRRVRAYILKSVDVFSDQNLCSGTAQGRVSFKNSTVRRTR